MRKFKKCFRMPLTIHKPRLHPAIPYVETECNVSLNRYGEVYVDVYNYGFGFQFGVVVVKHPIMFGGNDDLDDLASIAMAELIKCGYVENYEDICMIPNAEIRSQVRSYLEETRSRAVQEYFWL